MSEIVYAVEQVRARRGLSQQALAQISGVSLATIRSLEAGTARSVRLSTLARLCEVLHCQPGDLFQVDLPDHAFPVLGGPEEDDVIRRRVAKAGSGIDGPALMADLLAAGQQKRRSR